MIGLSHSAVSFVLRDAAGLEPAGLARCMSLTIAEKKERQPGLLPRANLRGEGTSGIDCVLPHLPVRIGFKDKDLSISNKQAYYLQTETENGIVCNQDTT